MSITSGVLRRVIFAGAILSGPLLFTGCFTGIESTPKITSGDVRREKVTVSDEQLFLSDIDRQPLSQWTEGKLFYVTDDKVALIFGADGTNLPPLKGRFLTYAGVNDVTTVTGEKAAQFTFITPEGVTVNYRSPLSLSEWSRRKNVEIPFTIEQSVIQAVKEAIEGHSYYIITPQWYDTADQAKTGRKFVKVTIDTVMPGTTEYPIRLALHETPSRPFRLFMSVGTGLSAPRDFSSLFSFKNPRDRYPLITDEVWQNIINGRVAEGMTRDECRLAIGAPADIDRRPGYSYLRELWSYENGVYLIFEDGILRSFRR